MLAGSLLLGAILAVPPAAAEDDVVTVDQDTRSGQLCSWVLVGFGQFWIWVLACIPKL